MIDLSEKGGVIRFIKDIYRLIETARENGDDVIRFVALPYQKRTPAQNRRYWALVGLVSSHAGMSKDAVHEFLTMKFAPGEFGQETTRDMTKERFTEYLSACEAWAMEEFGISLPHETENEWEVRG